MPEGTEDMVDTDNPLLVKKGPPPLKMDNEQALVAASRASINFELHSAAISKKVGDALDANEDVTFDDVLGQREQHRAEMMAIWGQAQNLILSNLTGDVAGLREECVKIDELASKVEKSTYVNPVMFRAVAKLKVDGKLTGFEKALVDKWYIEGVMAGCEMSENDLQKLIFFNTQNSANQTKFLLNIAGSCPSYDQIIEDIDEFGTAPESLLMTLAKGQDHRTGPWRIDLRPREVWPLLYYCTSRDRRRNLWTAWCNRAAWDNPYFNNSQRIEEMRLIVDDKAKVLGYDSFSHYKQEACMAGSIENVNYFIHSLKESMKPRWASHHRKITDYAREDESPGLSYLQPWDMYYYCREFAQNTHELDADCSLRDYLPFEPVLANILDFCSSFFGLRFKNLNADDKFRTGYQVFDKKSGESLGYLYFDPFMRVHKTGNSHVNPARPRAKDIEPVVIVTTNFVKSSQTSAVRLHWIELVELMAKMGEALQMLLCESPYPGVSGATHTEYDCIEAIPSFMVGLLHDPPTFAQLTHHFVDGSKLSIKDAATTSHCFMEAGLYDFYRKIFVSEFDQTLWQNKRPFWRDTYHRLWEEYFPMTEYFPFDCMPLSFTPIVTMRLQAAYYGKLWSEMLAMDMLKEYKKARSEGKEVEFGMRMRSELLKYGGGKPFSEQFDAFLDRAPSLTPILEFYEISTQEFT